MAGKLRNDLRMLRKKTPVVTGPYGTDLKEYYILFRSEFKSLNRLLHSFDDRGIPLNTTYIDVENASLHYYPISIGQYALARWHDYIRGEAEAGEHFMRIADWFVDNANYSVELGAYWLTDVPKPEYQVSKPWKSAFSQSRAISVLLRAWQKSGDEKYFSLASNALIPFSKDIKDGGVSVDREMGTVFYEEYVAQWPTRVLDGHIFSLFGLFDYIRAVPPAYDKDNNALALELFEEGISGLLKTIHWYDTGKWLRFNRCDMPGYPNEDPCTIGYMNLVIGQMEILYHMTGKTDFKAFAQRWSAYLNPIGIINMYRLKMKTLQKLNRL